LELTQEIVLILRSVRARSVGGQDFDFAVAFSYFYSIEYEDIKVTDLFPPELGDISVRLSFYP
jgi:hypothetical protein